MTLNKWCIALFFAGLVPGIYQFFQPLGLGIGPGFEMPAIARNLVQHGVYGDAFRSLKTGPTANNPPLYPLFLALCMRLFRKTELATLVIFAGNILVNALVPALLPRISLVLLGALAPGIIGGGLSIATSRLIPPWESNYTQLGLILFCLLTARLVRSRGYRILTGAAAGIALGVLFLLSQVVLLFAIAWIGFLLISQPSRGRGALRFLTALAVTAILVNLPWLIRNYGLWGEFVSRTNLGQTLYASNNNCAEPSLSREMLSGCHPATHPESSAIEAAILQSIGEPAYDRLKTAQALQWMRSHPRRFFRLTGARIAEFWFPPVLPPRYSVYMIWAVTILSIPGFVLMFLRRIPVAFFIGTVFLIFPLLYYVVVSDIRYRVPILWLSSLSAGYFLSASWQRFRVNL